MHYMYGTVGKRLKVHRVSNEEYTDFKFQILGGDATYGQPSRPEFEVYLVGKDAKKEKKKGQEGYHLKDETNGRGVEVFCNYSNSLFLMTEELEHTLLLLVSKYNK